MAQVVQAGIGHRDVGVRGRATAYPTLPPRTPARGHNGCPRVPEPALAPVTSFPKSDIRVLLLEGISDRAAQSFADAGYSDIRRFDKALPVDELHRELREAHIVGIRSRTRLDAAALAAAPRRDLGGAPAAHERRVGTVLQGAWRNLLPYATPAQNVAVAQRAVPAGAGQLRPAAFRAANRRRTASSSGIRSASRRTPQRALKTRPRRLARRFAPAGSPSTSRWS